MGDMIDCKLQGCGLAFATQEEFSKHVKIAHKITLERYFARYPSDREHFKQLPKDIFSFKAEKRADSVGGESGTSETITISPQPFSPPPFVLKDKFSAKDITDIDYIKQVLEEYYPEKWEYFRAIKEELIESGLPDGRVLDQFAFQSVIIRDIYLGIMAHPDSGGRFVMGPEEVRALREVSDTTKKVLDTIKSIYEKTVEHKKINDYVEEMLNDVSRYVKEHVGEYSFRCNKCGNLIDSSGYEHWAFDIKTDINGRIVYLLWSDALWDLVRGIRVVNSKGEEITASIPIWMMAFALNTSIEGLLFTAKERGMEVKKKEAADSVIASIDGVEFDVLEQEEIGRLVWENYKKDNYERIAKLYNTPIIAADEEDGGREGETSNYG